MTVKLRIRFVLISFLALVIMQSMIIFFSTQGSYRNMTSKADSMISAINDAYPADAGIDARYFIATVGNSEPGNTLDMTNIRSIRKDQAREYIKAALDSQEDRGFIDTFRYHIYRDTQGIRIIFLSRSHSIDAIKNTIISSILFSAMGLSVMLLLLIAVSFWVTRPVKVSYEKQQQFVTSASHELGTPLTVIKADTDILQLEDPENEWLCDIQTQTARLTEMTQRLTALAKMDEQGKKITRIDFPISDLAEDVANSYRAMEQAENKPFTVTIEPNLTYNGDENMIRQLLTILLDNSFKYCPPGGTIELSLKKAAQGILLSVCNTTDYIQVDELSQMFDRFYRSKNANSSGKKGFGLGLSIASAIIKAHKSKITAKAIDENKIQIIAILK